MKKLLVSLLAIAGLVACTNDEVVSVQKGNPIAFDTFVENVTRVGYDSNSLTGFDVWAFIESTNGRSTILTGEDVNRNDDGKWWYGNTQYWVPGNTYYFAALAPMNSQNVRNLQLATGDAAYKGLGTVEFTNVDGTEDLIYAVNMVEASETTSKVTFTFNHLLSKVKFSFTNTFDNANYSIQVRNIQMTAPETGTVNLAADEVEWTPGSTSLDLDFGETGTIAQSGVANSAELLTIPAGATQEYIVTFKVDLYVGNGADKVLAKTYEKSSTISGIELEAGKAYNFAAAINAESLKLNEVIFDASVNGWGEDATVQLIDTAAELVDAFNTPEVNYIILDGDIDLSDHLSAGLVIPAGRTLTLDLNGHTISQEKAQTGAYAMIDNKGTLIIEDNSSSKRGKIVYGDTGNGGNYVSNTISNSGVLTINGGTIENNSTATVASNGYPHPIDNSGVLTINGGTFTNSANYSSMRIWCTTDDDTIVTINGGTFNGSIDFQTPSAAANKGTLTINDGTFNADSYTNCSVRLLGFGADVDEMNGYIKGGHFTGAIALKNWSGSDFNSKVFNITGGTFTTDAKEGTDVNLLANGYAFVEGENGNWTVDSKGYYTDANGNYHITGANGWLWMADQNDTCFRNKTIYLDNDIDFNGVDMRVTRMFTPEYSATFDGQGHTVSNIRMASNYQKDNQALFDGLMTVKNLNVNNAQVYGMSAVGIIGANIFGTIENCHVKKSRAYGYVWQVGGIVGLHSWGEIKNCSVEDTSIECYYYGAVGAIAGCMNEISRNITNCSIKNCRLIKEGTAPEYADYDGLFGAFAGYILVSGNITFTGSIENTTTKVNGITTDAAIYGEALDNSTITYNGATLQ
ncbi:MAG: fimbrillin family protein [Alistipes sp.]|nr:fimbrillin family protein [Alistipes sp.]